MRSRFLIAAAVTWLFGPMVAPVLAQTSLEYAQMGMRGWIAFECAHLALISGETAETERLFNLGYNLGSQFIDAARASEIAEEDLTSDGPLWLMMVAQGPTTDFILGRGWEAAGERIVDQVNGALGEYLDAELKKAEAEHQFSLRNCRLVQ